MEDSPGPLKKPKVSSAVSPKIDIEINGETYNLAEIPPKNSGIVMEETKKLHGVIDLKALVTHLSRVGSFIRVAYNGLGALGHLHTEEQIEIQRLGYGITKICDKSALTVSKFKNATDNILTELQCTYGFLLDNMEDLAIDMLSSVSRLAGEMQKAAIELRDDFQAEEKKVVATLEKTQRAKKIQASKVDEQNKRRIELEESIKIEEGLFNDHLEKEKEAEARRHAIEQQEDKTISEIGGVSLKSIANSVTSAFLGGVKLFDTDALEVKADKLRQNRLEVLEVERKIREKRMESLTNMKNFTAKLKQIGDDKKMAECAVEALHEAVGALKFLSSVMMQAAHFWKQVEDHCRSLAESEMKSMVESAMKYNEKKRIAVWTSKSFKTKAIQFYSRWIALNNVCTVYLEQIKLTQKDFYKHITENPSYEESRKIIPELAQKFEAELKSDQKALMEKDHEAQREIEDLQSC